MANYNTVTINSDKITQWVALEILNLVSNKSELRHFSFVEGHLNFNVRGFNWCDDFIDNYRDKFDDTEIEMIDEFDMLDNFVTIKPGEEKDGLDI